MLAHGAPSLTCAELLAVLLRTGTARLNAVEAARQLLQAAGGSLSTLSSFSTERLCAEEGVGPGKAVTILAALELGRRFFRETDGVVRKSFTGPKMVYDLMLPLLKGLDHEECWILYLNRANYVVSKEKFFSGGLASTPMDSQVIIRRALECRASGIILVHNHPSGNPRPGAADIRQTRLLQEGLKALDLSFLDHVIVCDGVFYSFSEDRVLDG